MHPSSTVSGAVVVTGASSGIGRACALLLDRYGFQVFAGVRKEQDGRSLQSAASERLTPLLIDVTDASSIAQAAARVREAVGSRGLAGLVNNAGIGVLGPVEYLPLDDLHEQFDVNVFGQIAVTQHFLPLLRQGRGRVVNIGSIGDRIAMPFGGALCASKSALASLNDALRMELRPWGLHVCLVEPATIATPAAGKVQAASEALLRRLPSEGAQQYADMFRTYTRRVVEQEKQGSSPDVVAAVVLRALTAARPKTRYLAGKDSTLLSLLPRLVPERLLDLLRLRIFGLPTAFGALNNIPARQVPQGTHPVDGR
jgi:NAD(P)-dependent dehydrogenase (short-subunit alcohol dehydrogenase family)